MLLESFRRRHRLTGDSRFDPQQQTLPRQLETNENTKQEMRILLCKDASSLAITHSR